MNLVLDSFTSGVEEQTCLVVLSMSQRDTLVLIGTLSDFSDYSGTMYNSTDYLRMHYTTAINRLHAIDAISVKHAQKTCTKA